jgi:hypothetical protein
MLRRPFSGGDMPEAKPNKKKVVYLFGAGATHAELINAEPTVAEKLEERGVLMSNVSSRVIERARRDPDYQKGVEVVSGTSGSLNIELLVSLLENCKPDGWQAKSQTLKDFVQDDILTILTAEITNQFYLHKALFELHQGEIANRQEEMVGLISLNYESVLDQAYRECFAKEPDYCLSLRRTAGAGHPTLKLHGSFDWRMSGVEIRGRKRKVDIIPLGTHKSYDHAPYVFIWSRALEMLIECDALRIVGCSLSQNDTHLIELLFKAQVESGRGFAMEVVAPQSVGDYIRRTCGFFRRLETLNEIEGGLVAEASPVSNPFKEWLKYKGSRMLGQAVEETRYLRKVYD